MHGQDTLLRYVALGDSTAVGVGSATGGYPEHVFQRLRAKGISLGILNLARSGATTDDLVRNQLPLVVPRRPGLISLGIGTNDLWRMVPLTRIRENFARMGEVLGQTEAEVLVSNVSDLSLSPVGRMIGTVMGLSTTAFYDRLERINGFIAELAQQPRFHLIDLYTMSRAHLPGRTDLFCGDGFHPSDEGYRLWADLLVPVAEAVAERWRTRNGVAA